jgi:hypothetical protein
MTQLMVGIYNVSNPEHVTIEVVATKVGEFVVAALDGNPLNPTGHNPLKFEFDVTKAPGETHLVVMRFTFDDTTPADAQYQLFVQGSNGGGRFSDFTVLKGSSPSRTLSFTVV